MPTSFGDLAAGVALVDGGDTFDALRLKAAVVDAHALGQHEVALFGPVGAQPFEEFLGIQGVVRHVHALPDLAVPGPGLLLAGGGVYDRYPLAVLVERVFSASLRSPFAGLRVDAPVGDEDMRMRLFPALSVWMA